MYECRVCYKEVADATRPCPRCGFTEPSVVGDERTVQNLIARRVSKHRLGYLRGFDFGITVFYWKDENGSVVPDRDERISFGTGDELLDKTVWLDKEFARIPDVTEMELELSVLNKGEQFFKLPVRINVPQGAYLQQVGIELTEDMMVSLKLRNPEEQTQSYGILFLGE